MKQTTQKNSASHIVLKTWRTPGKVLRFFIIQKLPIMKSQKLINSVTPVLFTVVMYAANYLLTR